MAEEDYVGAEWRIPPMHGFLEPAFIIPIIAYFFIFEAIAFYIRSSTWTNHPSFERYRLHNLSVSLVHSTITGGCSLAFMLINPHIMFGDTMHWYNSWAVQLPLLSMGYFCHDVFDILSHERSRYAFECVSPCTINNGNFVDICCISAHISSGAHSQHCNICGISFRYSYMDVVLHCYESSTFS
uniref:TLC domain-containing protein n=1 Tax=Parascaris univalens TaxID=6257 RepID=A0A915AIV2_PARUN